MDGNGRELPDPLVARADEVIAESVRLRDACRRARLEAITRCARLMESATSLGSAGAARGPARLHAPSALAPLRALRPAEVIRREDAEFEKAWRRILPTIQTPRDLFRGRGRDLRRGAGP